MRGYYEKDITRGEFIYIAVRMYEVLSGVEIEIDKSIAFTDTNDSYALKGASVGSNKVDPKGNASVQVANM